MLRNVTIRNSGVIKLYDRSEMTQLAFCERHGINIHTFVAWLGKRRQEHSQSVFHEVMLPMPDEVRAPMQLEAILTDGTVIKSSDVLGLAQLLKHLQS